MIEQYFKRLTEIAAFYGGYWKLMYNGDCHIALFVSPDCKKITSGYVNITEVVGDLLDAVEESLPGVPS